MCSSLTSLSDCHDILKVHSENNDKMPSMCLNGDLLIDVLSIRFVLESHLYHHSPKLDNSNTEADRIQLPHRSTPLQPSSRHNHASPLLLAGRQHAGRVRVASLVLRLRLRLLQPRLQNRLQRDHVVVRQRQALEATDGALRQGADAGQLQVGQRLADIGLRDTCLRMDGKQADRGGDAHVCMAWR